MTSKIVVNNIEADSGVSTVTFGSNIQGNLIGNVTGNVNSTGVTTVTSLRIGTGTSISSPATNVIAFGTNNGESVRIDPNGRLGINTNNPGRALHIQGNGAAEQVWEQGDGKADRKKFNLVVDSGNSTTDSTIYLRHLNDNYTGGNEIWSYVGAGGTHRFYNGSGSVVQTLYNDGNVQKPLQSFCDTGDTTSYNSAGSLVSSPASAKGNWSSTTANVGNNFSTSTDLYTCPVAGVYAISSTCSGDNYNGGAGGRVIFVLSINGGYEEITEINSVYENQSPCVLRKLSANDTIGLGINGAGGSDFHVRLQVYYLG